MHICLAAREYDPHTDGGGIGAYTRHLDLGLRQLGHRVTTISGSFRSGGKSDAENSGGIGQLARQFITEAKKLGRAKNLLPYSAARAIMYSLSLAREIREIISGDSLDVLEVPEWSAEGLVVSLFKPCPLVVTLHTPGFVLQQFGARSPTTDRWLMDIFEKTAIMNADLIRCPSHSLARIVAEKYQIPIDRIHVVRYPVDIELFSPGEEHKSDSQTILYVGKLNSRKGVHTLALAIPTVLESCPDTDFLFAGPDSASAQNGQSCRRELTQLLLQRGVEDRVRFLPPQPREALVSMYRSSQINVVPSQYDNLPYSCLEAMACGNPVVASNVGGMAEIIESGINGLLVPPSQPELLAGELIGLLKNRDRRCELGRNARRYVEEDLACPLIAEHTVDLYDRAIASYWRNR